MQIKLSDHFTYNKLLRFFIQMKSINQAFTSFDIFQKSIYRL